MSVGFFIVFVNEHISSINFMVNYNCYAILLHLYLHYHFVCIILMVFFLLLLFRDCDLNFKCTE